MMNLEMGFRWKERRAERSWTHHFNRSLCPRIKLMSLRWYCGGITQTPKYFQLT